MINTVKKRLNKKGFTLAEVLVTVAIILILAGVTFVSVAQYQKNLRLMEMDGTAKEIFIAAQNHLSVAKASGDLDRLAEEANKSADGVTKSAIGTKLDASAVSAYTGDTSGAYFYMIHNATHGIESYMPLGSEKLRQMMLPFGALDETVATSGNYAIVYELKSASVVAVLYSGAGNASFVNAAVINFSDEDVDAIPTLHNDKSKRKNYEKNGVTAIVGCYTGTAGSAAIPTETLEAPKLEVKNENKLHVIVSGNYSAEDVITLTIHGVQSDTTAIMQLNCKDNDSNRFDVTLDDITSDNTRFTKILSSGRFTRSDETSGTAIIPGENIEISATARATDALATPKTSAVYTTSSLFADTNDGRTVYIKNLRHLENLSVDISEFKGDLKDKSGSTDGSIHAIQKNDITMLPSDGLCGFDTSSNKLNIYGSGTIGGMYIAANVDYPLSYDGGSHEIYDLSIAPYSGGSGKELNAGIFGNVTKTLSLKNLILRNDKIPDVANATNAGMLLGKTSANLTVDGVLAYYHENEYSAERDAAVEVQAKQVAGGLIGLVAGGKLDVKNSAAAVYVKGVTAAGGFIGNVSGAAEGSTIVQSYAGGHTKDGAYSTTDAANQPVLTGAGRYNVQASGYAGGFIGESSDQVSMNAVYSTASAYSDDAATSSSFSGNTKTNFESEKNYYAIGPHNGTDASADDTAKAQLAAGQNRRQATPYDRKLILKDTETEHKTMDKTSYPLCTVRNLCEGDASVQDTDLPWFIKEHVGDWVVSKKTEEANFEIDNGNRLIVRIDTGLENITDDIYYELKVHGHSSGKDAYFLIHVDEKTNITVGRSVYHGEITEKWKIDKNMNSICELLEISHGTYNTTGLEICLDDITTKEGRFLDVCSDNLWPGEDITVYASPVNVDGNDHYSATFEEDKGIDTNSIFGYLESAEKTSDLHNEQKICAVKNYNSEAQTTTKGMGLISMGNGAYYAQIDNSRHLQNLSSDISYQIKPFQINITGAIQTDNIYWSGENHPNSYTQSITKELGPDFEIWGQNKKYTINSNFRPIVDNNPICFYDGSGYKISGIKVDINEAAGLFGELSQTITVKNLTMESISVISNTFEAGGLIGYAKGNTTIKNVSFTGKLQVQGKKCTGGFIGQTDNIVDVSNSGIECDVTIVSKSDEAGGLIGYINGHDATAVNVKVVGKNTEIIATKNAGGLIGHIGACPMLNISNVGVSAFIISYSKEDQAGAGGLIGRIGNIGAGSTIEKSYYGGRTIEGNYDSCSVNEGTKNARIYAANINGEKSTGGLIGYIGTANGLSIEKCFSTGSVHAESEAAGGFIGSSLGWSQGSISFKNCYSMGKVSGTSSSKGGFIGKANGTSTFENVFYYSAFNTFDNPVGNNPGFSDIQVIDAPGDILATADSETVNTHIYDTPTLEGNEYPYKNWTTEHDDTSLTMVPTYYGDWPKPILLNGKVVFYKALDPNNYKNGGSFSFTGAETSFNADLVKCGKVDFQTAGFGIISEIGDRDTVKQVYKWSFNPAGPFEFVDLEGATKYSTFNYYGKPYYFYRISTDLLENLALGKASPDTFYIADASEKVLYKVSVKDGKAMFESYN